MKGFMSQYLLLLRFEGDQRYPSWDTRGTGIEHKRGVESHRTSGDT